MAIKFIMQLNNIFNFYYKGVIAFIKFYSAAATIAADPQGLLRFIEEFNFSLRDSNPELVKCPLFLTRRKRLLLFFNRQSLLQEYDAYQKRDLLHYARSEISENLLM